MHGAGAVDGHLQGGTHLRIQLGEGGVEFGNRYPNAVGTDAVETGPELQRRDGTALRDIVDDGADPWNHRVNVHPTAGQRGAQLRGGQRAAAQVDTG